MACSGKRAYEDGHGKDDEDEFRDHKSFGGKPCFSDPFVKKGTEDGSVVYSAKGVVHR